jgi:hypothetical protein
MAAHAPTEIENDVKDASPRKQAVAKDSAATLPNEG